MKRLPSRQKITGRTSIRSRLEHFRCIVAHSSRTAVVRVASHLGVIPRSVADRRKVRGGGILSDLAILLCLFLQRLGDMLLSKAGVPLP
jgi:hypothetical protein